MKKFIIAVVCLISAFLIWDNLLRKHENKPATLYYMSTIDMYARVGYSRKLDGYIICLSRCREELNDIEYENLDSLDYVVIPMSEITCCYHCYMRKAQQDTLFCCCKSVHSVKIPMVLLSYDLELDFYKNTYVWNHYEQIDTTKANIGFHLYDRHDTRLKVSDGRLEEIPVL